MDIIKKKKLTLIINTAAHTDMSDFNYPELIRLHEEFKEDLEIIAFPCNQFPGTYERIYDSQDIYSWLKINQDAKFHIMKECNVNDRPGRVTSLLGEKACDLYTYLKFNSELYDS